MTKEDVIKKAEELSIQHKCKVNPLYFQVNGGEPVVGYFKEPPRAVKLHIMDKLTAQQSNSAAATALEAYLIREESDSRIWDEKPENDAYNLAACMELLNTVQIAINHLKKN